MEWSRQPNRRQRASRDGIDFLIDPSSNNGRFIVFAWKSGDGVDNSYERFRCDRVLDAKAWAESWDFDEWHSRSIEMERANRDGLMRQLSDSNRRMDNLVSMERPS